LNAAHPVSNSASTTPAKVSPTPLMLSRRSRFRRKSESLSIALCDGFLDRAELTGEVGDRRVG